MIEHDAVLFIGFGGPEKKDDIMPFLEIVTHGRGIPKERLQEVAHHYDVMGGKSPINDITRKQASALSAQLAQDGCALPVYVGQRNWHPFLEDTLHKMAAEGIRRAVGFVAAAHRCEASWERYVNAVAAARQRVGTKAPEIDYVGAWFDHPQFIEAICERIAEISPSPPTPSPYLRERVAQPGEGVSWVFTAHSIPSSMAAESAYVRELERTASLVVKKFDKPPWKLAYSSRSGRPQDPWLEPDVCDVIRQEADRGVKNILFIPIGFIADHVEVLFDLDIEAKQAAEEAGVRLFRAQTVGDHPAFSRMMADAVRQRLIVRA